MLALLTAALPPDPVAGGSLNFDRLQGSVLDQPVDRPPIAGRRGRELPVGDRLSQAGDDGDVDGVLVRVDPAAPQWFVCHDGDALPIRMGRHRPDRSDRTYSRPLPWARLVLGHARPAGAVTTSAVPD